MCTCQVYLLSTAYAEWLVSLNIELNSSCAEWFMEQLCIITAGHAVASTFELCQNDIAVAQFIHAKIIHLIWYRAELAIVVTC